MFCSSDILIDTYWLPVRPFYRSWVRGIWYKISYLLSGYDCVCFRWSFLCQTNERPDVYHHDGPVSNEIWKSPQWCSGAALHNDGFTVGGFHSAGFRWTFLLLVSEASECLTFGCRQIFFCSSGATVSVILDLPFGYCVWISSAIAIIYTLLGGLYSVAYTDVIQLALTFISLVGVFRLLLRTETMSCFGFSLYYMTG